MKVSILIPVYGVERYIAQCAESLFVQTYKDIEYIFVDDCSPDNSIAVMQEVLERFPERQSQVKVVRHEKNGGLGQARLTALEASTGDFIMHVDSDDYMPSNAVELLVCRQLETEADIVDGGFRHVCDDHVVKEVMPLGTKTDEKFRKVFLCQNLITNNVWGRLFRRSLMTDNGIFPISGIDNAEDFCLTARLILHAKRATINAIVYCYRMATNGVYVHVSDKNIISCLKANQVVYDYYLNTDRTRKYHTALQIGMFNVVRMMAREHCPQERAAEYFHYKPKGIVFRFLNWALRGGLPYKLADMLYRAVRGIYIAFT